MVESAFWLDATVSWLPNVHIEIIGEVNFPLSEIYMLRCQVDKCHLTVKWINWAESSTTKEFRPCDVGIVRKLSTLKGPFILLCRKISVEYPTNFDLRFMLIGCLGLPLFWLDVSSRKFKFVGHSTKIIWQSEIKGPLPYQYLRDLLGPFTPIF